MKAIAYVLLFLACHCVGLAQEASRRDDASPHISRSVTAGKIRLHYLDWGGNGETILFLSGAGDTAHAFDQLAPRLTDRFRVLGLTRRGYGESEKPEKGYDVPTLTEDVRHFLDAMKIDRVTLIGHSAGGNEMIHFAGRYPDRTTKLVFLDAAYDRREVPAIEARDPLAERPSTKPSDQMGLAERIEGEFFREMDRYKPDLKRIKAPTLNFYAIFEKHWALKANTDEETRRKAQSFIESYVQPYQNRNIERFRKEVPHAKIVVVRGSHHYFFRDANKFDEVLATIRHFLRAEKTATPISLKTVSPDPSIGIESDILITADPVLEVPAAAAVMEVKKQFPLAMRRKDRAIFERILARDFTFRGSKGFFDRQDYIANRTAGEVTEWTVKFENIVLQFIGETCVLTYRNVINGIENNQKYTEFMTWTDVYAKEDGVWKLRAVHLVDFRETDH